MLSGGEPVVNKMFNSCLMWARRIFEKVSIITAHYTALSNKTIERYADDILFSFHIEYPEKWNTKVEIDIPVYASMVLETYIELDKRFDNPLLWLKSLGYAGATIRECYPDGVSISEQCPEGFPQVEGFSTRIHVKNNCVKENVLLLPDLTLTTEKLFS